MRKNKSTEISLSQEWIILSERMYGPAFISELSRFLKDYQVHSILECGCGGGHVACGLAKQGFQLLAIDSDPEMIQHAKSRNSHPNVKYRLMNWLQLDDIREIFDAVICRGNSLSYVNHWGNKPTQIDSKKRKFLIKESLRQMFKRIKKEGIFYIDTISQLEIDKNGGEVIFREGDIDLRGKIVYDWINLIRYMYGKGVIHGKNFCGGSASYLITPNELYNFLKRLKPKVIWSPNITLETNYHVFCARK